MEPTDAELQRAKQRLTEYADTIENGGSLHPTNDALEMDVDGGRIWLHPGDDGTEVNIHLFDDNDNRDFSPARSRLQAHITHELNTPIHGECEPYTPFIGNNRMHIRVNLKYLQND